MNSRLLFLCTSAVALAVLPARAVVTAYDDASNLPYASEPGYRGVSNGDNGGFGFGAWSFSTNNGGFFTHNEDRNVNNRPEQAVNPLLQSSGGRYFALWHSDGSGFSTATRTILGGLSVGDTFSMFMEHGWVDDFRIIGFRMINASSDQQAAFYFLGGPGGGYRLDSGIAQQSTSQGWTPEGMQVSFTLISSTTFSLEIDFLGPNTTETLNGTLQTTGGVAGFQLFSGSEFGGWERDFYSNQFTVNAIPEPSTLLLGTVGLVTLALVRRRTS
ncbi:MAG: PEP-CTERM sorting domain-containing protein [Terrimicrobiaceae bacterium]|nr:PEP-CTERM sorting domain-containing protein [Terrimicrobiaceae bacterium]